MKKRAAVIFIVCAMLLGGAAAVLAFGGRRPYKNLDAAQLASASVQLLPPDETVQITELGELAGYLSDVVIYRKDDSYTEYAGQAVIFTLTMADGTRTSIMAYNPFLVIDGVGYRTKYEPCEALSSYANRLLNRESSLR